MTRDVIFADHPDPIWVVCRASDRILAANRTACRDFGYSEPDFQAMTLAELELVQPGGSNGKNPPHSPCNGGAVEFVLEHTETDWQGTPARIVIARSRQPQPVQGLLRLLEIAMDRLKDIVMITEVASIDAPLSQHIIWVNDAFEHIIGYRRDEVIGKVPSILRGPETQPDILERIRNALDQRIAVSTEMINYRKDGTSVWLDIDMVPFSNAPGLAATHFIVVMRDITDRKRAEAALLESETRFQLVAKAANDVIFDIDLINDRVWWSEAMTTVFGHPTDGQDDTLGYWVQLVHPDDRDASWQSLMQALNGDDDSWVGEYRFRRADGRYANVVDRGLIQRDNDGRAIRWVGSMIDVTALRESEQNFRLAAKAAKDVIFVYDFTTDSHWWSEAIHTHYGHDNSSRGGTLRTWLDLVHPEDRERIAATHAEAARSSTENWTGHYRLQRADRRYAHVIDRTYFIRDADGRALRSIGSIVDVTQLRDDELRFRAVAQVAADAIYDYDPVRGMVHYSQGMRELLGPTWDGSRSMPPEWLSRIATDERDAVQRARAQFIAGGGDQAQFEYRLHRDDGSLAIVEEKVVALRDSEGRAQRVIGSIRDLSTARQMEERLRQSQKLEAVGHMTGGVAHDFNNLLTIILGNAELLENAATMSQAHRDMARSIVTAADRGAALVNSLLAFARRQPLDTRAVDMRDLCDDLGRLLGRTLPASIETEMLLPQDLWLAQVDRAQLTTALINLALNARDAMAEGGRLSIRCANRQICASEAQRLLISRAGRFLEISVTDTGTGMSQSVRERAFDPFFTTKPPGLGSGMGLSMVYGFAKQSDGHVQIQSEPGNGVTVTLLMPCGQDDNLHTQISDSTARFPLGAGEHILVVEDDPLLSQHVVATIQGLGYRVTSAQNAAQALEALHSQPSIALLFSDIVMPGTMDGRALAEIARQEFPSLRILLTTGYAENMILSDGKLDAEIALLPKPYRRIDIAHKLRQLLDTRRAQSPLSESPEAH